VRHNSVPSPFQVAFGHLSLRTSEGFSPFRCLPRSIPVPPFSLRIDVAPSNVLFACFLERAWLPGRLSARRCCLLGLVGEAPVEGFLLFRTHLQTCQRRTSLWTMTCSYFGLDLSTLLIADLRLWRRRRLLRLPLTHLAVERASFEGEVNQF
jgi:hypothetical protein